MTQPEDGGGPNDTGQLGGTVTAFTPAVSTITAFTPTSIDLSESGGDPSTLAGSYDDGGTP